MSLHDVWKGCRDASVSVVDVEKFVMLILCVRTTAAVWQGCEPRMGCYPLESVSRRLLAAIAICPDTRGSQSAKALRGCVDIGHGEEFSCLSTGGALADEWHGWVLWEDAGSSCQERTRCWGDQRRTDIFGKPEYGASCKAINCETFYDVTVLPIVFHLRDNASRNMAA